MLSQWVPLRWRRLRTDEPLRIGLFGLLGAGNLGNDGSLEAVLNYLREEHPGAVFAALCSGPEALRWRHGIAASRLHWYTPGQHSGVRSAMEKVVGKVVDACHTLVWVRRQDAVIVPGMGVLEATLPLRPWGFPYSLLCLCLAGRLLGTKILLVSVGAEVVRKRATRWVIGRAASLAHYRSFRDNLSRSALREMGVDTAADPVYPDLAFALPAPAGSVERTGTVGVGVMDYHGGNDDRRKADEIEHAYLDTLKRFVCWLIDQGMHVRLFVGDTVDEGVVKEVIADVRNRRTGPSQTVSYQRAADLPDLMRQVATVDTVIATRYHNVLCALKLSKPTISLGYAAKNVELMASMGLGEFCQQAREVDFDHLVDQFHTLQRTGEQYATAMRERNRRNHARLNEQFAVLSKMLSAAAEPTGHGATTRGAS